MMALSKSMVMFSVGALSTRMTVRFILMPSLTDISLKALRTWDSRGMYRFIGL